MSEAAPSRVVLEPVRAGPGARTAVVLLADTIREVRGELVLSGEAHVAEDVPRPRSDPGADGGAGSVVTGDVVGDTLVLLLLDCAHPALEDPGARVGLVDAMRTALSGSRPTGYRPWTGSWFSVGHPDASVHVPVAATGGPRPRGPGALPVIDLDLLVSSVSWLADVAGDLTDSMVEVGVRLEAGVAHTAEAFVTDIPDGRYQALLASGDPGVFHRSGEAILRWFLEGTCPQRYARWPEANADAVAELLARAAELPADGRRRTALLDVTRRAEAAPSVAPLGHHVESTLVSRSLTGFVARGSSGLDLRGTQIA